MNLGINSHYDIAAASILLIILLMLAAKKTIPIKRSFIFFSMCVVQIMVVVCSVLMESEMSIAGHAVGIKAYFFADLFFAFEYFCTLLFMYYMLLWSGKSFRSDKFAKFMFLAPVLAYIYIMSDNFLHHNLYVLDAEMGIIGTKRLLILGGVAIYAVLFGLIYATKHVEIISFGKLTVITLITLLVLAGMTVQYFLTKDFFINYVVAIAMLILYEIAQNPSGILDGNTQLMNRQIMEEILNIDIANKENFDLIIIALDDFKIVNKTYGIEMGDVMLHQVANFMNTLTRRGKVFRYGSDQFALQLRHGHEDIDEVLDTIKERFRHPWIYNELAISLSTTTICVCYPNDGDTLNGLIEVLDYSLLYAKRQGKGSVVFTKDIDLNAMRKEKAIENALAEALKYETLEVYYQPIYNTERNCYTSAEALVRLKDEKLGYISPEIFIPIAERTGRILQLGNFVFEKVCEFISENNLSETTIDYIEVNVSVVQCMQENFVEQMLEIMNKYHVRPDQINLEITETAEIEALATLQSNVEKLHSRGISFSLDDYGSGYSTLGYIHQFPFRIIKLDKLMVWNAFENEKADITLKYTVGMLKELNVDIVAEGVETQQQQQRLSNIGCDYLQGWYYSKAITAGEFANIIERKAS
ncbi:MAG: EAL domain-containing protein [Lachnospiraceae bacterium]|nr:EAL domain-containing protein [Lachnospiraceae bacterium]